MTTFNAVPARYNVRCHARVHSSQHVTDGSKASDGQVSNETNGMQGVEVEPEVDFELLAEKTAGYSGDDITGVCRDAAMNGMRRKIMGKTPEQIR